MERLLLKAFQGRVPKLSDKLLAANQATLATNVDLRSGEIQPLKALNQAETTYDADTLSAYPIDTEMFSSTSDCDFVEHDVSGTPVLIVSDGAAYPKQYTDALYPSDHRRLGVVAPTETMTITFNTIGGISSTEIGATVSYCYTYITGWGEESAPSPATAAVDVQENQYISLSNIETPTAANKNNVTAIRIYRLNTGLTGAKYQYLDEIDDQETTYDDYDEGVGLNEVEDDTLQSEDWDEPPSDLAGICKYANGMLAGFSGNSLYLCEPYIVYAWPDEYVIDFDSDIVGIKPYNNSIVVCTESETYVVTGTSPENMIPIPTNVDQVCVAKRSMIETQIGVIYASPDGLVLVDSSSASLITPDLITKEAWQALTPANLISFWYDNMYVGFWSGTDTGFMFIDDTWIDLDLGSSGTVEGGYIDKSTDKLHLIMDRTTYAYLESFNDHATNYLAYTWQSKIFDFDFPSSFSCMKLKGTMTGNVTVTVYGDGGSVSAQSIADQLMHRLPGASRYHDFYVKVASAAGTTKRTIESMLFAASPEMLRMG